MARPPHRGSAEHDEAVQRRLALLGEELSGLRTGPSGGWGMPDSHTRVRGRPDPEGPPPVARDLAPWPADTEPADIPPPGRHAHRWGSGGRLRPGLGRAPLAGVLALVAAALAALCWWLLHTAAHPSAPVDLTPASADRHDLATPASALSSAPGPNGGKVTVDVEGKVRRPGIVVLDGGSRVIDAIKAAGGLRGSPPHSGLNLARVLIDGEQILVGAPALASGVPPAAATASAAGTLVNLNTADEAALEGLPEVGPVTAQSILDWRTKNGAFTSVQELLEVDGIGQATLDQLLPFVTV
jgi:competence protein ComEA